MTQPVISNPGDEDAVDGQVFFYYENNYGGYSVSTEMPEQGEYKRMVDKKTYDDRNMQTQEDMWGRRLVEDQVLSAQEQAILAEKTAAIAALAEATGLSVEQLQALFQ